MLTLCICGGGGLGTVCAGIFASQGYKVNILTGHPSEWSRKISVIDPENKVFKGSLNKISDKAIDVIRDSDIVLLTLPGYLIEQTLRDIKPFLKKGAKVGSVVSSTGFFFMAHSILNKDTCLFGFQRVPFISRVTEYGKSAALLGYKKELLACIENGDLLTTQQLLEDLFLTPVVTTENYLEVSLSNSNPILHTGRLYSLWGEDDLPKEKPTKFYATWDDVSSQIVLEMDSEFQSLLKTLKISTHKIPSLLEYYECVDYSSLTRKITSITAFNNIDSPMKKTEAGWIPDYNSRYFTEDFPFGLQLIHNLIIKNNLEAPTITKVLNWGLSKIKAKTP